MCKLLECELQWIVKIKLRINKINDAINYVYAHQYKYDLLRDALLHFSKGLDLSEYDVTPSKSVLYQKMNDQLCYLEKLVSCYNEKEYLNNVLNEEIGYVENEILKIYWILLDCVDKLNFSNKIEMSETDLKNCEYEDCKVLVKRLESENGPINFYKRILEKIQKLKVVILNVEKSGNFIKNNLKFKNEIILNLIKFKDWIKEPNDFVKIELVKKSMFSNVYIGYQVSTGLLINIHEFNPELFIQKEYDDFKKNLNMLIKLQYPTILPLIGISKSNLFCIFTKYVSGTTLFEKINKNYDLSPTKQTIIALGIAYGMKYIHSKGVVLRNLNPKSILLDADDHPIIGNIEYSEEIENNTQDNECVFSVYTAPEIYLFNNYSKQSDVYSYGILLWELFTRDIVFRGLDTDMVFNELIEKNNKPIIPKNCPPKLSKLMNLCWEKDPNKRPTFDLILKALETNEIIFPGTDLNVVEAYKYQFQKIQNAEIDSEKEEEFNKLINRYNENSSIFSEIIDFLNLNLSNKFLEMLMNLNNFINAFLLFIKNFNNPNLVDTVMVILHYFIRDRLTFLKNTNITQYIISIFMEFGSTKTLFFLDIITKLIQISKCEFKSKHFNKLSNYMYSNSLFDCGLIIKIFTFIINENLYDDKSSLVIIIKPLLDNLKLTNNIDLLSYGINLLNLLMNFDSVLNTLIENNSILKILPLCQHNNDEILLKAFQFINNILLPNEDFIKLFISCFPSYKIFNSTELTIQPLKIIFLLLKQDGFISKFTNSILFLMKYFNCKDPIIISYSLKLTFALITDIKLSAKFSVFISTIVSLLKIDSENVSLLAAACITKMIPNIYDLSIILKDNLTNYIKQALLKDDNTCKSVLRLIGSLSLTQIGLKYIETNNYLNVISKFLKHEESSIRQLSLMIFTSYSSFNPSSPFLIQNLQVFFDLLKDKELKKYSLMFMEKITVIPDAAISCINNVKDLLLALDEEPNKSEIITILSQILLTAEVLPHINEELVKNFFQATLKYWDSPFFSSILLIFDSLSTTKVGKDTLNEYELIKLLNDKFEKESLSKQRSVYKRIISRLSRK